MTRSVGDIAVGPLNTVNSIPSLAFAEFPNRFSPWLSDAVKLLSQLGSLLLKLRDLLQQALLPLQSLSGLDQHLGWDGVADVVAKIMMQRSWQSM